MVKARVEVSEYEALKIELQTTITLSVGGHTKVEAEELPSYRRKHADLLKFAFEELDKLAIEDMTIFRPKSTPSAASLESFRVNVIKGYILFIRQEIRDEPNTYKVLTFGLASPNSQMYKNLKKYVEVHKDLELDSNIRWLTCATNFLIYVTHDDHTFNGKLIDSSFDKIKGFKFGKYHNKCDAMLLKLKTTKTSLQDALKEKEDKKNKGSKSSSIHNPKDDGEMKLEFKVEGEEDNPGQTLTFS